MTIDNRVVSCLTWISLSLYAYESCHGYRSYRGLAPIESSGALESQCYSFSIASYNIKYR